MNRCGILVIALALIALALSLAGAAQAHPNDDKLIQDKLLQFVLDIGAIQSDAVAVRDAALRQQWAAVPSHVLGVVHCERRLQAPAGGDPSRKQALATLHQDVLRMQAAGAARDAGRTAASAQAVSADATAVMSRGGHL